MKDPDKEIDTMARVWDALDALRAEQVRRILHYLIERADAKTKAERDSEEAQAAKDKAE